ncbi:hypothetical protein GCM10027605_03580 [Micromonospora zhanjiangensis]
MMVPSAALAGAVVFGISNGALAASITVSGQTFKVSASKLVGDGFTQYGGIADEEGADPNNPLGKGHHPVAVSSIGTAKLYDLCQSVAVPGTPVVLTIRAGSSTGGKENPAIAKNMLIDMDSLEGEAVFDDIKIGRDAGALGGAPGSFGQSAKTVTITDLRQVARYTSAAQFSLTGLRLVVKTDGKECF